LNKLLSVILVAALTSCSATPYVKVGTGYKAAESYAYWDDDNNTSFFYDVSCKFELGLDDGELSYGFRHVSQCFIGAPFNDDNEYKKDEFFIDYKHSFK